jgi:IclR family transcriptional regulator, KDG regulon repressor
MDYTVSAVDEAVSLLLLVAAHPGLGVSEIARRSGNTKGRVFRLLTTLEQRQLVRRNKGNAGYVLGYQALHLGAAAHNQIDLARLVEKPLEDMGRIFNETIAVRVRDGMESVCIAKRESTQSLRLYGEFRRPLHVGASSKVLLAHAPEAVIQEVLSSDLKRFTAATLDREALAAELEAVRRQGYARSVAERTAGMAGVAVPIWDQSQVIAVLGITAPCGRMTEDRFGLYLRLLQQQAREISMGLEMPEEPDGP